MSATDELRAMLDERGVGCVTDDGEYVKRTTWHGVGDKRATFVEYANGECRFAMDDYQLTPEQAIVATLGGGTCVMNRVKMFPEYEDCIFECWECSACKRTNEVQHPRFCPNCGRKVDE